MNDSQVFKSKLKAAIEKKQAEQGNKFRVIADDGCRDKACLHVMSLHNELDPRDIACCKDRALSRPETFNGWTKHFRVLTEDFRHDRHSGRGDIVTDFELKHARHKAVVEMVCVTIQCEMDLGIKKLFDPHP